MRVSEQQLAHLVYNRGCAEKRWPRQCEDEIVVGERYRDRMDCQRQRGGNLGAVERSPTPVRHRCAELIEIARGAEDGGEVNGKA